MRNYLLFLFIIAAIPGCKKEDTTIVNSTKYIIAGNTVNTSFTQLHFNLANITNSDSVRSNIEYGSFDSAQKPIDIEIFYISRYSNLKGYFGNYCSQDLNFNINIQDRYIGIRRKLNNKYIYGWIEFSNINNENLQLKGCAFAD